MAAYREAGPTYPTEVIDEFATITFVRDCGENDEQVINCPASELPANFPANLR
jgi:phenolic acid decarboxylase